MVLGLVMFGVYLSRAFGAFLPPLTIARTSLCCAAAAGVGWLWTRSGILPGKVGTLMSSALCTLVFVGVAVASGELRPRELMQARRR